ncbi:MAG: hypothetical protein AAGC70_08760 [Pseudomonadota bacterium]
MTKKALFLILGFIAGGMIGVTAVYKLHPNMRLQSRCSYNLETAQAMVRNGGHVDDHRVMFHGLFDFVGVTVLPIRDAIFDSRCHGDSFDITLAVYYLKREGALSLNDLKRLRLYAKKNNQTELAKLISNIKNNSETQKE